MSDKRRSLASYFDPNFHEPLRESSWYEQSTQVRGSLQGRVGKWKKNSQDVDVFVPRGMDANKPPEGKRYRTRKEKYGPEHAGYNPAFTPRRKIDKDQVKQIRAKVQEYRNQNPSKRVPDNFVEHVPGTKWKYYEKGYDKSKHDEKAKKGEAKQEEIQKLSKQIKEFSNLLRNTADFQKKYPAAYSLMSAVQTLAPLSMINHIQTLAVENRKSIEDKYQDESQSEQRKTEWHSDRMTLDKTQSSKIKSALDLLKKLTSPDESNKTVHDEFYLGTTIPFISGSNTMYTSVCLAFCNTFKHQMVRTLAYYMSHHSDQKYKGFVDKVCQIELAAKRLHDLKKPKKSVLKKRNQNKLEDTEMLNKWYSSRQPKKMLSQVISERVPPPPPRRNKARGERD